MNMTYHFFTSLLLSILLFPFFKFNVVYIMVGGFLIDIDHYLNYILKFKSFSIKKAYNYGKNLTILYRFHIFHLIEILIICIILSFYSEIFLLVSIGLISHQLLDYYQMMFIHKNMRLRVLSIFQLAKKTGAI